MLKGQPSPFRGVKRAPEIGAKVSLAKKGVALTEAHRAALSVAKLGKPQHLGTRAALAAARARKVVLQ